MAALLLSCLAWGILRPSWWTPLEVQAAPDTSGKVRIIQFGDSHTAADHLQLAVRERLQQESGSGGIGIFLPCATPHPGQQRAWTSRCSKHWTLQTRPAPAPTVDFLGLPGMLLETAVSGATIQIDAPFSMARIFFLQQPGGGRVRFLLQGAPIGDLDLAGNRKEALPFVVKIPRQAQQRDVQRLEMRTLGGRVRLLSVTLEDARGGVVYSPLGVVGARAENVLHVDEELFAHQLAWENPDIVALAFGTNESSGAGVDETLHAAKIGEVVDRIRRATPKASILLIAPPDRGSTSGADVDVTGSLRTLAGVIRAMETTARLKDTGFLDLRTAMGGPGTAERWTRTDPALAQPDRTHFTPLGYQRLGAIIAAIIAAAVADRGGTPLRAQSGASSGTPSAPSSQIMYTVRGTDGKITYTNDPEVVRQLLVKGATLIGN